MKKKVENNLSSPEISVIIPFCGEKADLINCLNGIKNQRADISFEIIVVESGKESSAKDILCSFNNSLLISSKTLLYPGKARNLGIAASKADLLAFIDADCVPSPQWLKEIYTAFNSGNRIVIGPVKNLYPFHPIASVDNLLQFPDFQKYTNPKNITHFPACNLGITKELSLKSGEFPEGTVTGEDVKFSQRAIAENKGKVFFNRDAVVKHSGRKTFGSFINHNRNLGFHRGYLNLKLPEVSDRIRVSFLFSFLSGIRRFIYISVRTLQWNPAGFLRIIFYLPIVIIGLWAWVSGFWEGNKKLVKKTLAV
jgi:glycosyltransferase involved in cell wall biosynthesis